MTSLQKLKEFGESIGLKGEELCTFIKEQQAEERAARVLEREQIERDKARELEKMKLQRDLNDKDKAQELEKMKLQMEQQKLDQQAKEKHMEIELTRMQIENGVKQDDANVSFGLPHHTNAKLPKMPYFDEDKDCMDAYLNRFERFANAQGWKKESFSICLAALLKGKALDVYSRLPSDQVDDYDCLKEALLKRYQLTEDGFKRKFRSAKPEVGESPAQFLTRLASYLERWVELSKVEKSFEGLASLMIREQYLSICSESLALFLKERAITDLDKLATSAEQYTEAHNESFSQRSSTHQSVKPRDTSVSVKKCFKCGSNSHLIKDCKTDIQEPKPAPRQSSDGQKNCFLCGKKGHLARNCFSKVKAAAMYTSKHDPGNSPPKQEDDKCHQGNALHLLPYDEIELKCGCKLPVIADGCQIRDNTSMPVTKGRIGDKQVNVLRDTGCSTVIVRESLVSNDQLTGESRMCILIDGTVRKTPVANIHVQTPYLSGTVKAICMKQPIYDLIIGNVEGVKDETVYVNNDRVEAHEEDQAVETRGQNRAKVKPVIIPPPTVTEFPSETIVKRDDECRCNQKANRDFQNSASHVQLNGSKDQSCENDRESDKFRKLFIGNLSYSTTDDSLREYFRQFGDVVDCIVMKDATTKRSRGFGFVVYSNVSMVDAVQAERPHIVDDHEVDTRRAMPKEELLHRRNLARVRKVFVDSLNETIDESILFEYFSKFGHVDHVDLIRDRGTKRLRGFAFVTFNDYDPVDKAILQKYHMINGRRCEVKKALSKPKTCNVKNHGGRHDQDMEWPLSGCFLADGTWCHDHSHKRWLS